MYKYETFPVVSMIILSPTEEVSHKLGKLNSNPFAFISNGFELDLGFRSVFGESDKIFWMKFWGQTSSRKGKGFWRRLEWKLEKQLNKIHYMECS